MTTLLDTAIAYEFQVNPVGGFDVFVPVSPSKFLPDAPSKLLRQGRFAKKIDIITRWNENDGSIFISSNISTTAELVEFLQKDHPGLTNSTIDEMLELYPVSEFPADPAATVSPEFFRGSQIQRDLNFVCPSLLIAQAMANYSLSNTTTQLYALNATVFFELEKKEDITFDGVSHFSDIQFVFNQAAAFNVSQADIELASHMSGSWAAFANTGKPTLTEDGGNLTLQGLEEATTKGANMPNRV
jgi:carboxylesterase type B